MVADWERAKAYTREYLDAATDETIAFKPTPEMRTFAQQMLHIADANYAFISAATGSENTGPGNLEKDTVKYNSKEALTKAVTDSYDFVISELNAFNGSTLDDSITIFGRFNVTRKAAFDKGFNHQTHHRGQVTVYLRLTGIKPPSGKLF
jgi:uncharacterized damage-inducible protein DinB